jgi:hypothetical protein
LAVSQLASSDQSVLVPPVQFRVTPASTGPAASNNINTMVPGTEDGARHLEFNTMVPGTEDGARHLEFLRFEEGFPSREANLYKKLGRELS